MALNNYNEIKKQVNKAFGGILDIQKDKSPAKYNFEQERSDYLTPPGIFDIIFKELKNMGIECNGKFSLDTCASQKNVPAKEYNIEGITDGLAVDWCGVSYCNPPYKTCDKWVKKAYAEFQNGAVCVLLIPARTETKYWQNYILNKGEATRPNITVKFLRKGLKFLNPDTHEEMGVFKNALAIVIMDGRKNACTNNAKLAE